MKRHLIHTEEIKKAGAKLQFQIRLPRRISKITGIQVSLLPKTESRSLPPIENEEIPPGNDPVVREPERGWLRLRIPDRRDVFYADNVFYPSHKLNGYYDFNQSGLAGKNEWWFIGKRQKYYSVDVHIQSTFIEAFYEDQSTEANVDYQLKIYFKVDNRH